MRTPLALLAFGAFLATVMSATIMMIAIQVVPYVVLGAVIATVIRRRGRAIVVMPPRPLSTPPPAQQLTTEWTYVPVWVGSAARRDLPIIDAEVIEDPAE